jgi:hypothetical protein
VLKYTVCPGAEPPIVGQYAFTTDEPDDVELRASTLDVIERGIAFPDVDRSRRSCDSVTPTRTPEAPPVTC